MVMLAQIAQRPVVLVLLDSSASSSRIGDAQRVKTPMETGEVPRDSKAAGCTARGAKAGKGNKAGKAVAVKEASPAGHPSSYCCPAAPHFGALSGATSPAVPSAIFLGGCPHLMASQHTRDLGETGLCGRGS